MTVQNAQTAWFLAQIKPNCAQIAQRNLQRQGFATFLPMIAETRPRNARFVTRQQPLFPGYIFVALDVAQGLWRKVNATQGITRLVSFGSAPAEVPQALIAALKQRCDTVGEGAAPTQWQPGDKVTFSTGPFANFMAEIDAVAPDQRVWVLIDIMGRQTRVGVAAGQVKLA